MKMAISQFIQDTLISGIGDIVRAGGHYHAFSLSAQGIELLGACLDELPFHHKGSSSKRFREAIQELFPVEYQIFNESLPPGQEILKLATLPDKECLLFSILFIIFTCSHFCVQ